MQNNMEDGHVVAALPVTYSSVLARLATDSVEHGMTAISL